MFFPYIECVGFCRHNFNMSELISYNMCLCDVDEACCAVLLSGLSGPLAMCF
jgi:hypothetical protein